MSGFNKNWDRALKTYNWSSRGLENKLWQQSPKRKPHVIWITKAVVWNSCVAFTERRKSFKFILRLYLKIPSLLHLSLGRFQVVLLKKFCVKGESNIQGSSHSWQSAQDQNECQRCWTLCREVTWREEWKAGQDRMSSEMECRYGTSKKHYWISKSQKYFTWGRNLKSILRVWSHSQGCKLYTLYCCKSSLICSM